MFLNKGFAFLALTTVAALLVAGCGGGSPAPPVSSAIWTGPGAEAAEGYVESFAEGEKPALEAPEGKPPPHLVVNDLETGSGKPVGRGDEAIVRYVGIRWNGEPFQSSWDSGKSEPFRFDLGRPAPIHQVMPGWEKGVPGMKVGGVRELIIPPQLLYYPYQNAASLQPKDSLVYVVNLIGMR